MDYNKTKVSIGKVRSYNNSIGDIISKEGVYLFTQEELEENESININDIVLFRGEEIQNQKKAFFIKKLNPNKNLKHQVYTKKKSKEIFKEND